MGHVTPPGGGGWNNKLPLKKRDRAMIVRALHALNNNQMFGQPRLHRILNTASRSSKHGTFNAVDQQKLEHLINRLPSQGRPFMTGDMLHQTHHLLNMDVTPHPQGMGHAPGIKPMNPWAGKKPVQKKPPKLSDAQINAIFPPSMGGPNHKKKGPKGPVGMNTGKGKSRGKGKGGKVNGNFSQDNMAYYGLGTPPVVGRRQAATLVGRDINQQVGDILGQIKSAQLARKNDISNINGLYNRTTGDLNYIYGEANDAINGQNQAIAQRFGLTQDQIKRISANLSNTIQTNSQNTANGAMAELQRLGIQQTGLGQYGADAANNQQVASIINANQSANLDAIKQNELAVGNMLQSMSDASKASALGQALNARQDAINQVKQTYRGNANDLLNQINHIKSGRENQVEQLQTAMQQNAFQQWLSTQQQDFNNQLAANQFNLDVSKLNSDNLWQKAKLRQQAAQEAAKRQQIAQFMAMQQQQKKNNKQLNFLLTSNLLG